MKLQTKRYLLRFLWLLIIPVTWVLITLAKQNPAVTETLYSNAVYPVISFILPFKYIRFFSFFEVLLLSLPLAAIVAIIVWIAKIVRSRGARIWAFLFPLQSLMITGAFLYFLFYLLWGFNYYRSPYHVIAHLDTSPASTSELAKICEDLINKANESRALLPSEKDGALKPALSSEALQDYAKAAYSTAFQKKIPGIRNLGGYGKPLLVSPLVSYTGIVGIFFPYTGESNYNNDAPPALLGSSLCHELAHLQGFSREDEANYISYLVCTSSKDPYLRYSGYLSAVINAMNKLSETDHAAFSRLYARYSVNVLSDLNAHNAYWNRFEGPVSETVTDINDNYLKANAQTDGVQSYGRMVDLLIAQYRANALYDE